MEKTKTHAAPSAEQPARREPLPLLIGFHHDVFPTLFKLVSEKVGVVVRMADLYENFKKDEDRGPSKVRFYGFAVGDAEPSATEWERILKLAASMSRMELEEFISELNRRWTYQNTDDSENTISEAATGTEG